VDLKNSLNLPQTDFPMKANLPTNEPKMLTRWAEIKIYEQIRKSRHGQPTYVLHDGPPYANGPIHLGTAMNKCIKDFIVKSKTMAGFDSPYVPGWDCHGLPIEIKVDEKLGRKKLEMDPLEVRRQCRDFASKFVALHTEQFQRIGVFGDFEHPYLTMNPQYEAGILENFFAFLEKDLVYKGLRPVYWCVHDKTALAEAEVEYEDHTSPSIWVRYALTSDPAAIDAKLAGHKVATIIWTTTPWTLPASMAVAFNPVEEYVALQSGEWTYIIAARLAVETAVNTHLGDDLTEVARFPGAKLEQTTYAHPFLDRKILGVLADYVTMDQGTGAVHTAPSHGADDFYTGVKYNIDPSCRVDAAGRITEGLEEYKGLQVFKANEPIVGLLKSRGVLLGRNDIQHSYPHCWRCHNPVIFRATEQWFIGMDRKLGEGSLRSEALAAIDKVKWDPAWGRDRIANMVEGRPDWCISRQRVWGVPIAVFVCKACNEIVRDKDINRAVIALFGTEGADAWYRKDPKEILPPGYKCSKCSGTDFQKETDIIDVWFESGSSQAAVLGHKPAPDEPRLPWPADLYLEGGDQYRGWFQSSLLCAMGMREKSPFLSCVTHGWTLDDQGRAQSKSIGNTVDPVDISKRLGGEIVRLWVSSVDFREDVVGTEALMQRIAENYRKLRNTFRYVLGNLAGFRPSQGVVPFDNMEPLDQFMLIRVAELAQELKDHYAQFAFHRVYQRLTEFFVVDLSAQYFDILKDRLYTFPRSSRERLSAQTALWRIGEALVRLIAPIMSFTADEVWTYMPQMMSRPDSVHLALFPNTHDVTGEIRDREQASKIKADWDKLFTIRTEALKGLEELRKNKTIAANLEAKVTLTAEGDTYKVLLQYAKYLPAFLVVSQVVLVQGKPDSDNAAAVGVQASKADGIKCERCWNFSTHVGEDHAYPTVCERCSRNLKIIEQEPPSQA
jgi:isoleucyl-tRNA synthetase